MDTMIFFWLGVSLFFLLLEMGSPGLFFFLSFFIGALFSASFALLIESSLAAQGIIFLSTSIIAFFALSYWIKKNPRETSTHKTNIFTLQGKHGSVIKDIKSDDVGLVKIGGEIWSARCAQGQSINNGSKVIVVQVRGAHVVVREIEEN